MKARKAGDWLELVKSDMFNVWTTAMLQECCSEVEQEDDERKSIVQQILQKSTDFLRRIMVPVGGQRGVTGSYVCPYCHWYPLDENIWWV